MTQTTAENPDGVEVETILCTELVNSWTDLSEAERDSLLGELVYPNAMLCPKTDSIIVRGGATSDTTFELEV